MGTPRPQIASEICTTTSLFHEGFGPPLGKWGPLLYMCTRAAERCAARVGHTRLASLFTLCHAADYGFEPRLRGLDTRLSADVHVILKS